MGNYKKKMKIPVEIDISKTGNREGLKSGNFSVRNDR